MSGPRTPGMDLRKLVGADELARYRPLESLPLPQPLRLVRRLIVWGLMLSLVFLTFMPYIQTAGGTGRFTALEPAERSQTLNAFNSGRIAQWHVREGSRVRAGDPVVDIEDLDPDLIQRLDAEQAAVESGYQAAREAALTALSNLERQRRLHAQGLSSQVELEQAQIRYQELRARENGAAAALEQVRVARQRSGILQVRAPADGTVLRIRAGNLATFVRAGDIVADFIPEVTSPAVELLVSGLDASLVTEGRKARLVFNGWPAVQFTGWPQVAVGTFGGVVTSVDPVAAPDGRFRVLIEPDPDDAPWPGSRFLRQDSQVRGWILLDQVSVGYELWRRLNGFPPELTGAGADSSGR